jgi:hypothetical protein
MRSSLKLRGGSVSERDDGGETELMLDRNGNIRARWTATGPAVSRRRIRSSPTPSASRCSLWQSRAMPVTAHDENWLLCRRSGDRLPCEKGIVGSSMGDQCTETGIRMTTIEAIG